jgi:hypothetical protein
MAWLTENGFIFMSSEKELLLSEMGQREAFRINKIRARQDFNRLINSATDSTAYLDYCEEIYGYRMYLFNMMDKQQLDYLFNAVTVTEHLKNIFTDGELEENSVCRKSRRTGADGKEYNTKFYNLEAVISVGFRTNSERAIVFRSWASTVLKEFYKFQTKSRIISATIAYIMYKMYNGGGR